MSELGNKIRLLRGDLSQAEFADKVKLSLRTICKLEAGESVRLDTIQQIARACQLEESDRLQLTITWFRLEVGEDFHKLVIEIKGKERGLAMKDADYLPGKIQVLLNDVPRKQQEQIYLALQRPEILNCLRGLNELYDSLKSKA